MSRGAGAVSPTGAVSGPGGLLTAGGASPSQRSLRGAHLWGAKAPSASSLVFLSERGGDHPVLMNPARSHGDGETRFGSTFGIWFVHVAVYPD